MYSSWKALPLSRSLTALRCFLSSPQCKPTLSLLSEESGSSLVELALVSSLLILLLVGSVDLGQACYVAIELSASANAGAQYGTQNPTDTSGMKKAALLNAANLTGAMSSAAWGCECSDGTAASPSCTTTPSCGVNVVRYVAVATAMTYKPLLNVPGVPTTYALQGNARLRAAY